MTYNPPPEPPGYGPPQPGNTPPPGYGPPPSADPPIQPYQVPAGYAAPGETPVQPYNPYQAPPYAYGYQQPRHTEGMAIAALVVSCAGIIGVCTWGIGGILSAVGAILGHVARRRISRNGTDGAGLALAGIIVGWVLTGLSVLIALLIILVVANPSSS